LQILLALKYLLLRRREAPAFLRVFPVFRLRVSRALSLALSEVLLFKMLIWFFLIVSLKGLDKRTGETLVLLQGFCILIIMLGTFCLLNYNHLRGLGINLQQVIFLLFFAGEK